MNEIENLSVTDAIEKSQKFNKIIYLDESFFYENPESFLELLSRCDDWNFSPNKDKEYKYEYEFWKNDPENDTEMLWRIHI